MKTKLLLVLIVATNLIYAQQTDSLNNKYVNSAEKLLSTDGKLLIGGYGEVHYNQPLNSGVYDNGNLDVHRMVLLFGYNFSKRIQFISEVEFEHVKEVYIEQAFLQYRLNNFVNIRGGLMLIPMGIINEYHEPTAFNGVERPFIDQYIAPSTWREIGVGLTGNVIQAKIRYQLYVVNGFNGYDGSLKFSGQKGFRGGRQKGAESYISSPNFTGKVEYYGIRGLNVGLSGYFGKTQSTLYNGLDKNDKELKAAADSSVVGISMVGVDARYSRSGFTFRGQYYFTSISNTGQYNFFGGGTEPVADLGSSMTGYYIEAGYNVFNSISKVKASLTSFLRYEHFNTHNSVVAGVVKNPAYKNDVITTGLTLHLTKNVVAKADMQFLKSAAADNYSKIFNAGIGLMF